jgi:uncharacterized membrane protein YqgA involved in biofilm formation
MGIAEFIIPMVFFGALGLVVTGVAVSLLLAKLRILHAERLETEERARTAQAMGNEVEEGLAAITQAVDDLLIEITDRRKAATYSMVPTELMQRVLDADAKLNRALRKGIR